MWKTVLISVLTATLSVGAAVPLFAAKTPKDPARVFSKRDRNGDGKLSVEEFQHKNKKAGRAQKKAKRFAKFDADGDGFVSEAEFVAHQKRKGKKKR